MEMIQKTTSLFYVAKYGRETCQRQALEIEKDFEKVTGEKFCCTGECRQAGWTAAL